MAGQDKLVCTECGSTFFYTSRAEQFQTGGYGSAEFRSLSNAPKTILVCVGCGVPVTPKSTHYARGTISDVAEQEFRKSIEEGQKFRKANSAANFAQIAASPAELQKVRELVDDVKRAVEAAAKPKGVKAKQEVKRAVVGV